MGTVKRVNVTVSAGKVSCTPDPVKVSAANVLIVFDLQTAGYAFPATNAVVVMTPGTQFPYPSWTMSPSSASLLDIDGDTSNYAYTVNVVELSTGHHLSVDPTIKNGTP